MSSLTSLNPTVVLIDGLPRASSLDIAMHFKKQHKDVMRAIHRAIEQVPEEFGQRNFAPSSYSNEQGKQQPMYLLTYEGFSFVAMGFTGKEAAQWKIVYIEAFHAMAEELARQPQQPTPLTEKDILAKALEIVGSENEALSRQIETLAPKADFADAISDAEGGVSVNRFSKVLTQHGIKGMGSHQLYKELRSDGFTIKQCGKNWNAPKQKYIEKGWFRVIEYLTDEDDSVQCITTGFVITGKGQQELLAHFMDKYGLRRQFFLFDKNRKVRNAISFRNGEIKQ